jgi:hypothetical protein
MGQSYTGRRLVWQGMDVTQKTRHREPGGGAAVETAIWASKSSRRPLSGAQKVPGDPPLLEVSFSLI